MAQNLKTGDVVKVIAGDNKGKSGKIVKMDTKAGKAMVEGLEVRTRHMKATYLNPKGGKKEIHVGIDLSNLKLEKAAETKKAAKKGTK